MTDIERLSYSVKEILSHKTGDSCTLPEDDLCHTSPDCTTCLSKRIIQLFDNYIGNKLETMKIVAPPENVSQDFVYGTHKQINYDIKHIRGRR